MSVVQNDRSLLEAENEAERLAYLGTATTATSHQSTELTWVVTGVPAADYNGVLWAHLSPDEADIHVPMLVQQFRDQGLPALWHVDPQTEPTDLVERLRALGCPEGPRETVMAARLNRLAREMSRFPGLTVDRVTTAEDLGRWLDLRSEIIGEPDETRRSREALYVNFGFGGRQPLHFYLAHVDDEPAGIAQLFLGRRTAGLYSVGVAPRFRGRGIGTSLVLTPLLVARTLGYDTGVVRPPADSQVMYEHLGFEALTPSALGYVIGTAD